MYEGVGPELSLVSYSHPYPICMLTVKANRFFSIFSGREVRQKRPTLIGDVGGELPGSATEIEMEQKAAVQSVRWRKSAAVHTQNHFAIT